MNYIQSLDNVIHAIENNNLKAIPGKSKLSIIVENRYEIFITHYPLWNNEKFLYSIGCIINKTIIKKNITEELVADTYFELIRKGNGPLQSQTYVLN